MQCFSGYKKIAMTQTTEAKNVDHTKGDEGAIKPCYGSIKLFTSSQASQYS